MEYVMLAMVVGFLFGVTGAEIYSLGNNNPAWALCVSCV